MKKPVLRKSHILLVISIIIATGFAYSSAVIDMADINAFLNEDTSFFDRLGSLMHAIGDLVFTVIIYLSCQVLLIGFYWFAGSQEVVNFVCGLALQLTFTIIGFFGGANNPIEFGAILAFIAYFLMMAIDN